MSAPRKIACVDFGATKILAQVFDVETGKPVSRLLEVAASKPNKAFEDRVTLRRALETLRLECGFDAISVGMAAFLDREGTVIGAGNLKGWRRLNLGDWLREDFGVPNLIFNDAIPIAANEIVYGVLSENDLYGLSGIVVAPGTGVAVCTFVYLSGRYHIFPGEGAHSVIDLTKPPDGCGCGRYCVESMGSGRVLERLGNPNSLSDKMVNAILAPPLATLIANITRLLPNQMEIVLVSGGIAHKRPSFTSSLAAETSRQLGDYVPTPLFEKSRHETGGLQGCLAYWILQN